MHICNTLSIVHVNKYRMYSMCNLLHCPIVTVPSVVSNLTAEPFGVTCIEVSWSGPGGELLRGPEEDRIYYITIIGRGGSFDYFNTDSNSVLFLNATPGELYVIEVYIYVCL